MWQLWAALAGGSLIGALSIHPDHAGSKSEYALIASFILFLGLTVVSAAVAYRAKGKRAAISRRLAEFVRSGQEIISRCHDTAKSRDPAPDGEARTWADDTFNYLRDELGAAYAIRFDNPNGLPMGMTVLGPPYSQAESLVKWHLARVHEIMTELASQQ